MSFVMDEDGVLTSTLTAQDSVGLQNDLVLIDQLISAIYADGAWVQINRRQMSNAQRRLLFVHKLLKQLPNPRPSPQIISVVRSLAFMVQQCSLDDTWPRLLQDYFTCEARFAALRARLRAVWKMHSTVAWEEEDRQAARADAQDDAALLLRLLSLPAVIDPPRVIAHYTRRALSAWRLPFEVLERVGEADAEGFGAGGASAREGDVSSSSNNNNSSSNNNTDMFAAPRPPAPHPCVSLSGGRHEFCVKLDEVPRRAGNAPRSAAQAAVAGRFVVQRGFRHHGQPVVVKVLEERAEGESRASNAASQATPSSQTLTAFIQDAVARVSWCHPDLVECYGAFTEKFVTEPGPRAVSRPAGQAVLFTVDAERRRRGNACAPAEAEAHEGENENGRREGEEREGTTHMASTTTTTTAATTVLNAVELCAQGGVSAAGVRDDATLGHCAPDGQPRLALGLVLEDMAPVRSGPSEGKKASRTPAGSSTTIVPPAQGSPAVMAHEEGECECLHDILFLHRRRFTVRESIDILLQMADVIQYILLDADKVPEEVLQAWLSIAPSNIYLVPLRSPEVASPKLDAEASTPEMLASTSATTHTRTALIREPMGYVEQSIGTAPYSTRSASGSGLGGAAAAVGTATSATLPPLRPSPSTVFAQLSEDASEWRQGGVPSALGPSAPRLLQELSAGTVLHAEKSFAGSQGEDGGHAMRFSNSTSTTTPPPPPPLLRRSSSLMPMAMRGSCGIRYSPPCYIAGGPYSRWRPHPQATSPACYALAQLLLALLTNRVPYAMYRRQSELRERVFGPALRNKSAPSSATSSPATTSLSLGYGSARALHGKTNKTRKSHSNNNNSYSSSSSSLEGELQGMAVKTTVMPGYVLPGDLLPPELRRLFRRAMSFDRTQRAMTLQELRERLWCAREEVQRLKLHRLRWPSGGGGSNESTVGTSVEMAEPAPAPDDYGEV